jgi:hypothetical protein
MREKFMYDYKFKLPIGDWSDDGHGICEYFIFYSNSPAKKLIESYIKACEIYKIDSLCQDYQESRIIEEDVIRLKSLGFKITSEPEPIHLAELVIDSIMQVNPEIKISIAPEEEIPLFCNWLGQKVMKKSGRVFNLPGYGLFTQ